jgi:hypothetical protein
MKQKFSPETLKNLLTFFAAKQVTVSKQIQELWSGYGKILRLKITDGSHATAIAKVVSVVGSNSHPRGWNTEISHQRKMKSYQVEKNWYQHWSHFCDEYCRVAQYYPVSAAKKDTDEQAFSMLIVMEDLDSSGYKVRRESLSFEQSKVCLSWLANFHATFLARHSSDGRGSNPEITMFNEEISQLNANHQHSIWQSGGYWHLATRPDEFDAMTDLTLKANASLIDSRLESCEYQTVIHGDAKLANFCFSANSNKVAAVDFQYVGAGCGMKDLTYFMSSCFSADDCEKYEERILDYYFAELHKATIRISTNSVHAKAESNETNVSDKKVNNKSYSEKIETLDFEALEKEWRGLYAFAWADFCRFMQGWSPSHWKMNRYSNAQTKSVIAQLTKNSNG